jgi:hypothetical protein
MSTASKDESVRGHKVRLDTFGPQKIPHGRRKSGDQFDARLARRLLS